MADHADQAARLEQILLRNRLALEAEIPEALLLEIAEIQEQNQFDDDRSKAKAGIRAAVEATGKEIRIKGVSDT